MKYLSEQIKQLHRLRRTQKGLEEELEVYKGLKPDLEEAKEQLEQIKLEFESLLKHAN